MFLCVQCVEITIASNFSVATCRPVLLSHLRVFSIAFIKDSSMLVVTIEMATSYISPLIIKYQNYYFLGYLFYQKSIIEDIPHGGSKDCSLRRTDLQRNFFIPSYVEYISIQSLKLLPIILRDLGSKISLVNAASSILLHGTELNAFLSSIVSIIVMFSNHLL